MRDSFDLVVVGGGPGGLAAAATAAEAGACVCLVDDNPSPGGQIWRGDVRQQPPNPAAAEWLHRLNNPNVTTRFASRAVAVPAPNTLRIDHPDGFADIEYSALVLATGARELFLPFPGWTLPGVYGAGGLQAFVKGGLEIEGKRIVVAGTGPLLLAVAAHLSEAGARVVSTVEQAPMSRLMRFSFDLVREQPGKLMEGMRYALHTAGVPYRTGAWIERATGRDRLDGVVIRSGARVFEIKADMLAIGYHLAPNTEVTRLLHCDLEHGFVVVDELQQTSVKGIYCVGESTGIGGLDKALIEGRIAALAITGQLGQARALFKSRDRQMRFARGLAVAFTLRDELRSLATGETIVCRCEDVAHNALAQCSSWREAKLHTRCGMGPCQGRICGPAAEFLFGWKVPVPRPPLFPIDVETLAGTEEPESVCSER
jgi:NADPH-dependent 2,4-dienoyl-CoA reductase/sulfur reductase-like enzyme